LTLRMKGSDIQKAYLTAPYEKAWTTLGHAFGEDQGKKALLTVRALYGLKSAGASINQHIPDSTERKGQSPPSCCGTWVQAEESLLLHLA